METADLQPQNPRLFLTLTVLNKGSFFPPHCYLKACFRRKARVISKSLKKETKKNQGSILTKEKLVFSGNSHNPFQSAIAVVCFVQGVRMWGSPNLYLC